ncbi:MAG TPA: hypothetical protein ENO40_07080 [Desulfurella acetivorans]|nr:hypothetical protein [Desulfurella acetivorans]
MKRKKKKRENKVSFAVADIETVKASDEELFNSKFYLGGIYSEERGFLYFSNIEQFIKELENYQIIFFHNLNFDLQVLIKNLQDKHKIECKAGVNGSRLIQVRLQIDDVVLNLADSMNIYNMSLEKLERSFKIERKTSNIKQDRENIEKYDRYEVIKYLEEDCLNLYNILKQTFEFYGVKKLTIASLSYYKLLNDYLFNKYRRDDIIRKFPDWVRGAYKGGRVEVFKRYGRNLYYYDVNSLYPKVMFNNEFPIGRGYYTNEYVFGKLGVYKLNVKKYKPIGFSLLSIHNENGKLLFVEGENYEACLTSAEIDYMFENSEVFEFEVLEGLYFEHSEYIFEEFIDYFYTERKKLKQEGNPLEQIYKLTMNSCYGKFAEKQEKEVVIFSNAIDENTERPMFDIDCQTSYHVEKKNMPSKTNIVIASFITAYARIYITDIMNKLFKNGYEVYYCDTDSVITNANEKQMSLLGVEISEELGALKLEHEIEEGYFILPKFYAIIEKSNVKIKAKGFDIKNMTIEDIKLAFEGGTVNNKSKRMHKIKTALKKNEYIKIEDVEKRLLNTVSDKRIYINDKSYTLDRIYEKKTLLDVCILLASKKYEGFIDKEFYYYLNRLGFVKDCLTNNKSVYEEFFNKVYEYDENVLKKVYVKENRLRVRHRKKTKKEDLIQFFFYNIIEKQINIEDIDIAF